MDLLACGHAALEGRFRSCLHLTVENDLDAARRYTGRGGEYEVVCTDCFELADPWSQLATICEGCAERVDEEAVWTIVGQPEVLHRDRPIGGHLSAEPAYLAVANDRCLAPHGDGWLVFTGTYLMTLDGKSHRLKLPKEDKNTGHPQTEGPALHVSADGRFAAVAWDHGRYGRVVDLTTGRVTVGLDRGDERTFASAFPCAFLPDGTLVAGTAWNRLDLFDPATGALLTPRVVEQSDRRYHWHGRLHVSPTGEWIVDDGMNFGWQGEPKVHDVPAWRGGDVYSTEHSRWLCTRPDVYGLPIAWVDDTTVAIQGVGDNDEAIVDGVQLYDVRSRERIATIFGPKGRMWGNDGGLAVDGEEGLELWDVGEGARVGVVPGFHPMAYNARTRTFAALRDWTLRTYRLP
ncbi:hypothetical protein HPO96_08880 [Kribbella sandramycini]|uniref:WD40 repeat domain-containing protein n=1 Tax=Kribbella sandramycini TaxID=60450 RepID=A0A7Y4KXA1_9ACTN|nr:hypothetical protein [Kribbella sandramycini]MBB6569816.1 hypothetical protein [Kribbella sandramycini]NOL40357.1 hypothetical protein [Kribbella sandramycini]